MLFRSDRRYTIAGARRTLLDDRKLDEPQVEIAFTEADRKLVLIEVKDELRSLLTRLRREREPAGTAGR